MVQNLGQKSGGMVPLAQYHPIFAWLQAVKQVLSGLVMERFWLCEAGNFNVDVWQFTFSDRRKTGVFQGGQDGMLTHVQNQWLIGFQSSNAATQAAIKREGDKTCALLLQNGGIVLNLNWLFFVLANSQFNAVPGNLQERFLVFKA